MKRAFVTAALVAGLVLPAAVEAQGGAGFLFRNPRVSIGLRTGYQLPRAGSNIFDFSLDSLTLSRSDFGSPYLGGELAIRLSDRWDIAASAGWARSRSRSEYRNWVDQDNNPIEQETTLETISGSLGAKYYFADRGRSIGRFAWVPARLTPYVGAGVGVVSYDFLQAGDFVDFQTFDVYGDTLETSGSGASVHGSVGADFALGKQFFLTGEAPTRTSIGSTSPASSSW